MTKPRQPTRTIAALVALELLGLGGLFLWLLVANWSDNAYLGLTLIGAALSLTSGPFVLAATLPDTTVRRVVFFFGVGLLGLVGLLSGVILVGSLLSIPSQNYRYDTRVFGRHLAGYEAIIPRRRVVLRSQFE